MKAHSSGSWMRGVWVAGLLCMLASVAQSDVGGGRGRPATPWGIKGPDTVEQLETARAAAEKVQALWVPGELVDATRREPAELREVSLQPVPSREGDEPTYQFTGTDTSGHPVSLSFSSIEKFVVTAVTDRSITLTVTIWPDLPLKDLIKKQPTYTALKKAFRHDVTIQVALKTDDNREWALSGGFGSSLPLSKLKVGTKGDFYGGDPRMVSPRRFWWAIPSVTNDPEYPFRMMPKA